jgi:hypothetical protein
MQIKKVFLHLSFTFLFVCPFFLYAQDFFGDKRAHWLQKAKQNIPQLVTSEKHPVKIVTVVEDTLSFQNRKILPAGEMDSFYGMNFSKESAVILDFGEHLTGHLSFTLASGKKTPDSPARLKFTFGETPSEVSVSFDPYPGGLSRAWLQDETVTVTTVPGTVTIPRRVAFRYLKIEVTAAPSYDFSFSDIVCRVTTSAVEKPEPLPVSVPQQIRDIDRIAQATLKECMQTVYEDGPKRDRRLWIGDLYLESLGNNYSFRQFDLTRRCLYLIAGVCSPDGYLFPNVFEEPEPHAEGQVFLYEYALLFGATLKDYLEASGDRQTAGELWPAVKRQNDIVRKYLGEDGLIDLDRLQSDFWVFMDWKEGLHKEVAVQGVALFALRQTLELAKMLGRENEVSDLPELIKKISSAARKTYLDKRTGLFIGKTNRQVSYASQIWMILGEVATGKEGMKALSALEKTENVCRPGTPYLYHYYIQSLVNCGMYGEAREKLTEYWGGMAKKGADTFWEAYDPDNDFISPYNFYPVNSYCHAWSCTPVYFIRKYPEIFRK